MKINRDKWQLLSQHYQWFLEYKAIEYNTANLRHFMQL